MELKHVTIRYQANTIDKHPIIHRFSYTFPKRGLVVIVGDSGIGKSSLLRVLAGLIQPAAGQILYPKEWKFKKPIFFEDQMTLIPHWHVKDYFQSMVVSALLLDLGLDPGLANEPFQHLSVGQRIRVMIGLFFSQASDCYLFDEPTHALDEKSRDAVIRYMMNQSQSHLIVIATHDPYLIEQANEVIHIHHPYQITVIPKHKVQTQGVTTQTKIGPPILTWRRLLKRLHHGKGIGMFLMLASLILQTSIQVLLVVHHGLNEQQRIYQNMIHDERLFMIQEIQRTSIDQSPYQLVKTISPNVEQIMMAFSSLNGIQFYPSIQSWFPKTYVVQGVSYQVRFVDMPFELGKTSLGLIHLPQHDLYEFRIETFMIDENMVPLSIKGPLHMVSKRVVQSFFEPPQILLSYWQCLYLLQTNKIDASPDAINYLNLYQMHFIPEAVIAYDPQKLLPTILNRQTDQHPWTISLSVMTTYQSMTLILTSLLELMIGTMITLVSLCFFVWWTRLHWVYQRHHQQWHWIKRLGFLLKPIWHLITSPMHLLWEGWHLFLAILVSIWLLHLQTFIYLTMVPLVIITMFLCIGMIIMRSVLLNGYTHA